MATIPPHLQSPPHPPPTLMPINPDSTCAACADQSQTSEDGGDVKFPSISVGSVGGGAGVSVTNRHPTDETHHKQHPISATATHPHPPSHRARNAAGFYFRWTIVVLNVGLELSQAVLAQEASNRKIGGPTDRLLTATTSSICLALSALEIVHANRAKGVVLQQKRRGSCAMLPIHGSLSLWFGLLSSTVQFCVNVTALAVEKAVLNFDYAALLFSLCYFFAAISGDRSEKVAVVKCVSHGNSEAQVKFVDGMWVFECPRCTVEKLA